MARNLEDAAKLGTDWHHAGPAVLRRPGCAPRHAPRPAPCRTRLPPWLLAPPLFFGPSASIALRRILGQRPLPAALALARPPALPPAAVPATPPTPPSASVALRRILGCRSFALRFPPAPAAIPVIFGPAPSRPPPLRPPPAAAPPGGGGGGGAGGGAGGRPGAPPGRLSGRPRCALARPSPSPPPRHRLRRAPQPPAPPIGRPSFRPPVFRLRRYSPRARL